MTKLTPLSIPGAGGPDTGIFALLLKWAKRAVVILALIWVALIVLRFRSVLSIYHHVALWLSLNLELSDQIVTLLAIAVTALALPLVPYVLSFLILGRRRGSITIIVLAVVGVAFGTLYFFGGDVFFTADGEPLRCWALTPAGIKVIGRTDVSQGCGVDRTFSVPYQPMNANIAPSVLAARSGARPSRLNADEVLRLGYFDAATGKPNIWFSRNSDGSFNLYSGPGFDSNTRQPLEPVGPDNVQEVDAFVQAQEQALNEERQRAALARQRKAEQEQKEAAALKAEKDRQAAEARRLAAAKEAERQRIQTEQDNNSDIAAAQAAFATGNRVSAREFLDAVLARTPSHAQAVRLYATWKLSSACPSCGNVVQIRKERVDKDGANVRAASGGALGLAVAEASDGSDSERLVGAAAGALIGKLLSKTTVYMTDVRLDSGDVVTIPMEDKPLVREGDRVVVGTGDDEYTIVPQPSLD